MIDGVTQYYTALGSYIHAITASLDQVHAWQVCLKAGLASWVYTL